MILAKKYNIKTEHHPNSKLCPHFQEYTTIQPGHASLIKALLPLAKIISFSMI
jgi:hypothetical protein